MARIPLHPPRVVVVLFAILTWGNPSRLDALTRHARCPVRWSAARGSWLALSVLFPDQPLLENNVGIRRRLARSHHRISLPSTFVESKPLDIFEVRELLEL